MYYTTQYASPIGALTLACDGERLAGLWIEGQMYFGALPQPPVPQDGLPVFHTARRWLDRYFAGEQPDPNELPLAPVGGEFRQKVWQKLLAIPYGQVTTYGTIAKELDASPRAVGGAVGRNPISILIPCHRVIGAGRRLTGYAGGLDKKIWLLAHEGVDTSRLLR